MVCGDCRYFSEDEHQELAGHQKGTCLKFPPTWMRANGHDEARFPPVYGDQQACGEFKVDNLESIEI